MFGSKPRDRRYTRRMAHKTPTPGSFCWFELATSDQTAAKKFYSSIFDWNIEDSPMGPGEFYSMCKIDGKDAAAVYTMRPEQRSQGVPPNWMLYVMVKSADEAAARAKQLGAAVLAPPFDVMDAGRMSVIQEPTGAVFALWQPKTHGGALAAGRGSVVWADLNTSDPGRAGKFYGDLFGWKLVGDKSMRPVKPGEYTHIVNGTDFIGGIPPAGSAGPGVPSHWLIYFDVADCKATTAKVTSLGGRALMAPMTMEGVRTFSVLADPQGAAFAIVQSHDTKRAQAPAAARRARPAKKRAKTAVKAKPRKAAKASKSRKTKPSRRARKPARARKSRRR